MYQYANTYDLKNFMKMNDHCPVCGQPLDMEPGFYYGTNMISYALAILLSMLTFFLWWGFIGFSLSDKRFFWWIGLNALLLVLLQPPLMRLTLFQRAASEYRLVWSLHHAILDGRAFVLVLKEVFAFYQALQTGTPLRLPPPRPLPPSSRS